MTTTLQTRTSLPLKDRTFQYFFSKTFVYNILFEDTEVDERFLELDEESTMLSITGAGCSVATSMSQRPRRIDAVDINPHHLALSALKMISAQHSPSYSAHYDLCGRGWSPEPKESLAQIAYYMPNWIQRYWKKHARRFERSLYQHGLTSKMIGTLRKRAKLNASWLREVAACKDPQERVQRVERDLIPILQHPIVSAYLRSPLQLLALGV
ncbi:MAG: DUF3419 family protein, partial [Myxococcota bacterium]